MNRSLFFVATLTALLIVLGPGYSQQNIEKKPAEKSIVQAAGSGISDKPHFATGSIRGRVIFQGEPPPRLKLMLVKDVDVCGREAQYDEGLIVSKNKGIENAVVYLTGVQGGKPLSSLGSEFVLNQRGCRYRPHVLLVPVNTPLKILNDDGILHNFHTFSKKNRPINMAQPPFRKEMETVFKYPEFIRIRCDIHGWMSGWIVAVDQPYYAVTDADGNFSLDDIPPGTYTLNCWQEKLGEQTRQIIIAAGGVASPTFAFNEEKR